MLKYSFPITFLILSLLSCKREAPVNASFELLRKNSTGLDFDNILNPSLEFNPLTYMYFFDLSLNTYFKILINKCY